MRNIDCLFIGHNQVEFNKYESDMRKLGVKSGIYREIDLSYITYNNKNYTASHIYNLISNNYTKEIPSLIDNIFSGAVAYLGTYLERKGLSFDYISDFQKEKEELKHKLRYDSILTIAITTTHYLIPLPIQEIIEFIRTYNSTVKIIVGGPFISSKVKIMNQLEINYLFNSIGADVYVNSSQGEYALYQVVTAYKNKTQIDNINNIFYKENNIYYFTNAVREDNDLSENWVKWNLFNKKIEESVVVRTSISCPFSCSFCGFPKHAGKYKLANIDVVENELKLLAENNSVKSIFFTDDTFNVPKKRFKQLLQMIIRNKFSFKWVSHIRPQFIDEEIVELMKRSNCDIAFLGIESGNDLILNNMNKKASIDEYYRGVRLLKDYEIATQGSFIIGFPGETMETVGDTLKFINESGIDFFRTQLWYCDPITPIFQEKEKFGIKGESFEWSHNTMDAKTALDVIDDIFMNVENPVWVPLHYFDFCGLTFLRNKGLSFNEIKSFLLAFNQGVKEKLNGCDEISLSTIDQIKNSIDLIRNQASINEISEIQDQIDLNFAEFDF